MLIANLRSKFSDLIKSAAANEGSIGKKIESISSNFRSMPTIIAKDFNFEGNITGLGFIEIEGNIKGTISGNSVVLREEGYIEGEISAESLNIRGKFNGNIRAKNISITSKAKVTGLIEYESLSVEDGACIDGQFKKVEKLLA
ncbi:MAG: polymer-forming cytoskeletal protein [Rickettsiales bacterium]|nr:polymer-forming cytoskeletal protein [Rickettsiales bacterium]